MGEKIEGSIPEETLGASQVVAPDQGEKPAQAAPAGEDQSVSTMKPSEKEKEEQAAEAATPSPPPPPPQSSYSDKKDNKVDEISYADIALEAAKKQEKMAKYVLDSWVENVAEQGKRAEKDREERDEKMRILDEDRLKEYYKDQAIKAEQQKRLALEADGIKTLINTGSSHNLINIAAAIVVGTTAVGEAVTARDAPHATSPFSTPNELMIEKMTTKPDNDLRAEFGLLGTLVRTFPYYSTPEAFAATDANAPERDQNFAKTYAKNLVSFVIGEESQLEAFLRPMLESKLGGSESVANNAAKQAKIAEHIALAKITLLATALAVYYKMSQGPQEGGITGAEFLSMMNGDKNLIKLPPTLEEGRKEMLRLLQTLPDKGAEVLLAINAVMDENPKLDSLLKPARIFAKVNQSVQGDTPRV